MWFLLLPNDLYRTLTTCSTLTTFYPSHHFFHSHHLSHAHHLSHTHHLPHTVTSHFYHLFHTFSLATFSTLTTTTLTTFSTLTTCPALSTLPKIPTIFTFQFSDPIFSCIEWTARPIRFLFYNVSRLQISLYGKTINTRRHFLKCYFRKCLL